MTYFALDNVSIQFGGLKAVDGVSFDVAKGEIRRPPRSTLVR